MEDDRASVASDVTESPLENQDGADRVKVGEDETRKPTQNPKT